MCTWQFEPQMRPLLSFPRNTNKQNSSESCCHRNKSLFVVDISAKIASCENPQRSKSHPHYSNVKSIPAYVSCDGARAESGGIPRYSSLPWLEVCYSYLISETAAWLVFSINLSFRRASGIIASRSGSVYLSFGCSRIMCFVFPAFRVNSPHFLE